MNVSLTPQLEQMIRDKVESGRYNNASEVVREALRIMADHEERLRIRSLRDAAIAEGIASLERGEGMELTDELWAQIIADGEARAKRGDPIDPLISGEF
jgi:antitoxin ParD1/3/4